MKIGILDLEGIPLGKHNIKDSRLDLIEDSFKSHTKTYAYVEFVDESKLSEAEVILVSEDARSDLILKDLEFVDSRLGRAEAEAEKKLLNELKKVLEKEAFVSELILSDEEKKLISGYPLLTSRHIFIVTPEELSDLNKLILEVIKDVGYISFFTANEKEARSWLVRSPITAWEAAGKIHRDIQKGFIRAEVINWQDLEKAGSVHAAKQAGALKLEQ
ncbi:MAG: DUF933 domain-containing protein, partial [Candidatus Omnitrophica bacterium]|nr:DUF933 domain-containing protein [Candidatus Omnitrophota bacterium]